MTGRRKERPGRPASLLLLLVVAFLLVVAGCAIPDEPPAQVSAAAVHFTPAEKEMIRAFYGDFPFPPGIAEPAILAPSLEARLQATAKVPPDLAGEPLPMDLENKLSPLPPGYERFRAGSAVILMDIRTREVLDQVQLEFR